MKIRSCWQDHSCCSTFSFQSSPTKILSVGATSVWCIDNDGNVVVRTEVSTMYTVLYSVQHFIQLCVLLHF